MNQRFYPAFSGNILLAGLKTTLIVNKEQETYRMEYLTYKLIVIQCSVCNIDLVSHWKANAMESQREDAI